MVSLMSAVESIGAIFRSPLGCRSAEPWSRSARPRDRIPGGRASGPRLMHDSHSCGSYRVPLDRKHGQQTIAWRTRAIATDGQSARGRPVIRPASPVAVAAAPSIPALEHLKSDGESVVKYDSRTDRDDLRLRS